MGRRGGGGGSNSQIMGYVEAQDRQQQGIAVWQADVMRILRRVERRIENLEEQQHDKWMTTMSALHKMQQKQKSQAPSPPLNQWIYLATINRVCLFLRNDLQRTGIYNTILLRIYF